MQMCKILFLISSCPMEIDDIGHNIRVLQK